MISVPGTKRAALWSRGNLGYQTINLGIRESGTPLKFEDVTEDDWRGRQFKNYVKVTSDVYLRNPGRPLLSVLMSHARNGGVDCEFVTQKSGTDSYDGIYKFDGDNYLGLNFEYEISNEKRGAKVTLGGNIPVSDFQAIQTASQSNTFMDLSIPLNENPVAQFYPPHLGHIKYSDTDTDLCDRSEIKSHKLVIKTAGTENEMAKMKVDSFDISFELVTKNASKANVKNFNDIWPNSPSLWYRELNPEGHFEDHKFEEGVLTLTNVAEFGDKERFMTLTFKGKVFVNDIIVDSQADDQTFTYKL